jgi:hypothetical protein
MAVSQQGSSSYNFHLKIYLADELKKSIGFGNIQKPYNGAVDLLIASKMDYSMCVN